MPLEGGKRSSNLLPWWTPWAIFMLMLVGWVAMWAL